MPPKSKKGSTPWVLCEKCQTYVTDDQSEQHSLSNCPPNLQNITNCFIFNQKLFGVVDIKANDDIKGLSSIRKERMVFLSQSVFQLCLIAIEDWVIIKPENTTLPPFAKIAWPTKEKSLVSVLFTKSNFDTTLQNKFVSVKKTNNNLELADLILLQPIKANKNFEFTQELQGRLQKTFSNCLFTLNNKVSVLFYGSLLKFEIKCIKCQHSSIEDELSALNLDGDHIFYKTTEKTAWKIETKDNNVVENTTDLLECIGGLDNEIAEVELLMTSALSNFNDFQVCKAILLYGTSGTGKTTIAEGIALKSNANVIRINVSELYASETKVEEVITDLFKKAKEQSPSVILMDEVDMLCPSRSSRLTDSEKRTVSTLLNLMDELNENKSCRVFVIATTNKRENIDLAFRRCGRFDQEIEIPIPNPKGRYEILSKLLHKQSCKITEDELKNVSNAGHGYVGTDLVALCSQAGLHAFKCKRKFIELQDLEFAMKKVRPSAMRAVQIEVPNVKWSDIGGQEDLKLILRQCVEWPLKHADRFIKMGITPPRGVLMYGPPGCSKTMIAKAVATESGLNFLSIKGPEIFNKWVGESERAIREIFQKARQVAPSIIFFDEIDAIGGERTSGSNASVQERVLAQLLTELDGVTPLGDVTILAATNRPDKMDKALLRPGRLDRIVYVPLPDDHTRRDIFNIKFKKMPVLNVNVEELVNLTKGYSGAEVNALCHEAAMMALEENFEVNHIEHSHFLKAMKIISPRTPQSLLNIYKDYIDNK